MVRNLATKRTQLVSTSRPRRQGDGRTGAHKRRIRGAVYPGGKLPHTFRVPPPLGTMGVGASISADGSTVAWLGQEIDGRPRARRRSMAPGIHRAAVAKNRRRTAGADPARHGGGDPASPPCAASGETSCIAGDAVGSLPGPFERPRPMNPAGPATWLPLGLPAAADANGVTVAFLATARYIASGEELGWPPNTPTTCTSWTCMKA